jgi:hypothetical protein
MRSSRAEAVEPGGILWFHTHWQEEKNNTLSSGRVVGERQWSQEGSSGFTLTGRKRRELPYLQEEPLTGRKRRALLYLQEEQWSRGNGARWDL